MNISQIPDNILLKIFQFLPVRDFIRCGGVNEQFRQISIEVTSNLKSIDLNDKVFDKVTVEQLGWLLEKCWEGLEKIKFRPMRPEFIEIFEQFSCPKLMELDLSENGVDGHRFGKLIRQNRNIEILKCKFSECRVTFPDVICEKLVALDVEQVECEDFFVSATGRCPNLKSLAIPSMWCSMIPSIRFTITLDNFFASCSKLEKISTKEASRNFRFLLRVNSFWRLNLREVSINIYHAFEGAVFDKFISSFRHLEVVSFDGARVTPEMISKMASLPKLRRLSLPYGYQDEDTDLDQSVNRFVGSEILQHLEVPAAQISPTTLKGFIRHCPQLGFLRIRGIEGIETAQDAANFIRSLNEFSATSRPSHLVIRLRETTQKIWESKEVKDAMKEVEEKLMLEIKEG